MNEDEQKGQHWNVKTSSAHQYSHMQCSSLIEYEFKINSLMREPPPAFPIPQVSSEIHQTVLSYTQITFVFCYCSA